MDENIKTIKKVLESLKNDDLSLSDLCYLEEEFNNALYELKDLKDSIVNDRFAVSLRDSYDSF